MPKKTNWTGLIGLVVDSSKDAQYSTQVTFTAAADELPASFDSQDLVAVDWNTLVASGSIQIPAQLGNGSDTWYLLFAGLPQPTWTAITISFYIIEMQTIQENQTSNPITLYSGQEFLYKVEPQ